LKQEKHQQFNFKYLKFVKILQSTTPLSVFLDKKEML